MYTCFASCLSLFFILHVCIYTPQCFKEKRKKNYVRIQRKNNRFYCMFVYTDIL